ncbi:MAG: hypothetical protein V3T86_13630 [Planctomycetota bacterium]
MITINLLPAEYRRLDSTPVARFLAIIVGVVLVTSELIGFGYVHYSKVKRARELREAAEAELTNKSAQAEVSKSLQKEISAYETRRKAIAQVAGDRILWSRKLDEFFDIIHADGDHTNYHVWLKGMRVSPPRAVRRGGTASGGTMTFSGFTETTEFSKVTNLRNGIRKSDFFGDFLKISPPSFEAVRWDDGMDPSEAGKVSFTLELKPLNWRKAKPKKGKKRK